MKFIKPLAALALLSASGLVMFGLINKDSFNTILDSEIKLEVSEPTRLIEQESTSFGVSSSALRSSEVAFSEVPKIPETLKYYINDYDGKITFGGGETVFPKTHVAISRAFSSVGDALSVCLDGKCFNKCDHLAGDIWGYEEASGYYSAMTHWQTAVAQGIAVKGDKEPPLGALLFWETGRPFGHVATYIGNGMVVTNAGGEYGSNVYIYYADWYDKISYKYLGWAPPVFFGEEPGSAL
jgi:hypothetical protein